MKVLLVLLTFFSLLILVYFAEYSKYASEETSAKSHLSSSRAVPIKISANSIDKPDAEDCSVMYIENYVFDHFEPMPGKTIGIWPQSDKWLNNKIAELHSKWGFNYILAAPVYFDSAQNNGFDAQHIMMPVEPETYISRMTKYRSGLWAYYIPEPKDAGHDWDVSRFYFQRNKSAKGPRLVMDGYKRTGAFQEAALYCDIVMFSSYVHWTDYGLFWSTFPTDYDQRKDWTDMRLRFGSKFCMTWISLLTDNGTYKELLGHASNLGLTGIWLFANDDLGDLKRKDEHLESFCNEAWKTGWLRKFESKHRYEYHCYLPNPCKNCSRKNLHDWKQVADINLQQFREVFP